ncbi:hypothetical protein GCM10010407_10310 [Rarobacter incanus]
MYAAISAFARSTIAVIARAMTALSGGRSVGVVMGFSSRGVGLHFAANANLAIRIRMSRAQLQDYA